MTRQPAPHWSHRRPRRDLSLIAAAALTIGSAIAASPTHAAGDQTHGRLVFATFDDVGNTTIGIVNADGTGRDTLANYGGDPNWSPTGNQIAVSGCDPNVPDCVTTILSSTGTVLRTLPLPAVFGSTDETAFGPSVWSPNGQRLAGGADSGQSDLNGLFTFRSSDGGDLRRITSNPGGEDIPGSYSPDGHSIVFVRNVPTDTGDLVAQALYIVRTDGTGLRQLTPSGMLVNDEHGGSWSPDGRTILFDARPAAGDRFTPWLINADGTGRRRIPIPLPCGAPIADPGSFGCFAPTWAPDGRHLAFGTVDAATGFREIYSVSLTGDDLHQLTFGPIATDVPDWSR